MPQIPPGWEEAVAKYIRNTAGDVRTAFHADDFSGGQYVAVAFEDGSNCLFRYALVVHRRNGPRTDYLVCTEHCGYYVFSGPGVEVRTLILDDRD